MFHLKQRWQLFAAQPFRWYFLSCILATLGSGLIYINLTWLALKRDNSIAVVALLMISFWVPIVVLGPVAGVIVDRFSRKWTIVIGDFLRAFVILAFYLLWQTGLSMRLWELYLMIFIQGVGLAFVLPATMAYVREIVAEKQLLFANATVDIGYEMGNIVGMGLAGFLIAWTSIYFALLLNAVCFLLAGLAVMWAQSPARHQVKANVKSMWQSIVEDYSAGMRYLKSNRSLLIIYVVQLLVMAIFMTSPVLLAPFAKNILHANVSQFGELEAAISVGVVLGGVITPSFANQFGEIKVIVVELCILIVGYTLFCLTHVLDEALVLNFFLGFGLSVWPVILTLAQKMTDIDFQGRVQSTFNSIAGLIVLVMYLLLGAVGRNFRVNLMFSIEAIFAILAIFLLFGYYRSKSNR